jgi:hypothetical protein
MRRLTAEAMRRLTAEAMRRLTAEAMRRLTAEAARRGVSIDSLITELAETLPAEATESSGRRRLAIAGVGASGGRRGRARDADAMLAEDFGRD